MKWIVAGLGNPGRAYEETRHNAGFCVLDILAARWSVKINRLKFQSQWGERDGVLLLKPQTFMNLSGRALREAAHYFQIPPERVLVIFDDTSLPPGRLRIRAKGSDGGHNGIKDILYQLQSDAFPRIKIGVGEKPRTDMDLADWVLSRFSPEERVLMTDAFVRAADAAECVLRQGVEKAMNQYNAISV